MIYPAYMPGHSQTSKSDNVWGSLVCERPNMYVGYKI